MRTSSWCLLALASCSAAGIALLLRGNQLLAGLPEPLLDIGGARRGRRIELVLRLRRGVAAVFQIAQDFEPLVGGGEQIEPAADLGGVQAGAHILDLLGDAGAVGETLLVIAV